MYKRILLCLSLSLFNFSTKAAQSLLISSGTTGTKCSADVYRTNELKAHFIIVVTGGSGTLVPTIQGKDYVNNYYVLLQGNTISGTGTTVLKIGLGLAVSPNNVTADYLPDVYRVCVTASGNLAYGVTLNMGP